MAWATPKTDWSDDDALPYTDLNRIEENTSYLKSDLDSHKGTSTIHKTSAEIRAESTTPSVIECRTSDPASPTNGMIWLRTDL